LVVKAILPSKSGAVVEERNVFFGEATMNTVSKYARRLIAGESTKDIAKKIGYTVEHVNAFRSGRSESLTMAELIIETYDHEFLDKLIGYNSLKYRLTYVEKQNLQYRLMLTEQKNDNHRA
jgi:hypothetical protein